MKNIGYYGIVDAEFKKDPRDGVFKFIELNPRVWMQNSFPSRYGCNLPYIAYLDTIGKPLDIQQGFKPPKKIDWVYFLQDIQSSRAAIQTGSLSLCRWLRDYNLRNDYAVFAWDDPLPFFVLGSQSISTFFSHLLRWNRRITTS
jgi:predicted ATP-grasp superfamily ATP-dependent carboligase